MEIFGSVPAVIFRAGAFSSQIFPAVLRTQDAEAMRRYPLGPDESQFPFLRDVQILIDDSLTTRRYSGKTQIFSPLEDVSNDMFTTRIHHVNQVRVFAKEVTRRLGLNEDLAEAGAIGHDFGHTPFGHSGERALSFAIMQHGLPRYLHSVGSMRMIDLVEKLKGSPHGFNLSLQVYDAWVCHDGEAPASIIVPNRNKTFEDLEREYRLKEENPKHPLTTMTLEGGVVRCADKTFLPDDVRTCVYLGMFEFADLPPEVIKVFGTNHRQMRRTLINDLVENSRGKDYIGHSQPVIETISALQRFFIEKVFSRREDKIQNRLNDHFETMYEFLLKDLKTGDPQSPIRSFVHYCQPEYWAAASPEEVVRDYMAGMTDRFFLQVFNKIFRKNYSFKSLVGKPESVIQDSIYNEISQIGESDLTADPPK